MGWIQLGLLWCAASLILGVCVGTFIKTGTGERPMSPEQRQRLFDEAAQRRRQAHRPIY